ncbi:cold-shock protein [Marinomonas balearica]|uniref:Cold shock CspA family protein n=1 Tax=Marinomonas balearica TaxID=491947 RepID=A0A4R6MBE0_9GAMM|nr:cold shock domain-containing protein [Marinomonas balearica]TDO98774.1 cold shock CspA family protein [Marinomonas balearica]
MKGRVKTFLPEKGYGFIKGDDSKDYFFHKSSLSNLSDERNICEEVFVTFEQFATAKGYQARSIKIVKAEDVTTYIAPNKFLYSKSFSVKGWEVLETSCWKVIGASRNSPEEARKIALVRARNLGASGMVEFEYFKTKGSEPGTGKGTYYFTVHNYRGRPAMLVKKNASSTLRKSSFIGLNDKVRSEKIRLRSLTEQSKAQARRKWKKLFLCSLLVGFIYYPAAFVLLFLGLFIIRSEDYDSWLISA